jgi:type II secretory pathway pseudopilin PulG
MGLLNLIPGVSTLKTIAIGAAVVALVSSGAYLLGKRDGRAQAALQAAQASIEAYETRKGIDHEVSGFDGYALCVDLGGLPDECEQLRRLDATTEGQ